MTSFLGTVDRFLVLWRSDAGGGRRGPYLQYRSIWSIVRPTILTRVFLGYVVSVALMYDLGRPYGSGIR